MADRVRPDQTAPWWVVSSGYTQFAYAIYHNPGPAESRYALSLQTVQVQISWLLQMWNWTNNLDQENWLAKN